MAASLASIAMASMVRRRMSSSPAMACASAGVMSPAALHQQFWITINISGPVREAPTLGGLDPKIAIYAGQL
jgi:hypothetical protein